MNIKNSAEFIALENQYGAHNYHPLPVVLHKGEGIFVWDEGNLKGHNYDGNWNNDQMDGEGEYFEGQK